MATHRWGSLRVWQTELFVAVIVVAILILSGSLSAGLKATLTRMVETAELRNASAFAQRLEAELPLGINGTARVREVVADYRGIYGGGIWVYDPEGELLESAYDTEPTEPVLESALLRAMSDESGFVSSDLRAEGWVVASRPIHSPAGEIEGVVITASDAGPSATILRSVRDRLWVTFWISLAVAGLLGFGFSELMSRRIRQMSDAAVAIAGGDFDQRLVATFVPDEVRTLAESYNVMAVTLGEMFSELQESRRQIAVVIEAMAEGVIAVDASGATRVVNAEASRLLGIPAAGTPPETLQELTNEIAVIDAVNSGLQGSMIVSTAPLGDRVVRLHCTPMIAADGAVDGAVLLLFDITDQHRAEAAQRRFVADASHELRTPIAAVKGMLELLDDGAKDRPDVRDDFIHTMQLEADRLGRLVSELLTLARLEAGTLTLESAPHRVVDIVGDVAAVMRTLAAHQGVALEVNIEDEDACVLADRDRIVQVLMGFTDNALRHTPEGGTIQLSARRRDGRIRFEVSDGGPGIPPDAIGRVFERFYRGDSSRGSGGGTGLGLAIAKEIVEAHGSTIEVRSEPGQGATFGFDLSAV
ncbi:MAG: ATP-binding protein [Coriobacteriia bacterium]